MSVTDTYTNVDFNSKGKKGGFAKGRFWRMCPCSVCLFGVQEDHKAWLSSTRVALQGKTLVEEMNIWQNHPFFCEPPRCNGAIGALMGGSVPLTGLV